MKKLLIVSTSIDNASSNLFNETKLLFENRLSKKSVVKIMEKEGISFLKTEELFGYDSINMIKVDESLLNVNLQSIELEYDTILFLSKHAAKSQNTCITVHPIGNFGEAMFGGAPEKLVATNSSLIGAIYNELTKQDIVTDVGTYEIALEATHHGPYSNAKCLFFELGASEENWNDNEASKLMANSLFIALQKAKDTSKQSFFGLGSNHYCNGFNTLLDRYDFAGSCPEHSLKYLSKEHISEIAKFANIFIFHYNISKKERKRIISIMDDLQYKYENLEA